MSKYTLGGDPPQSRAEQILMGEDVIPQSRLEELLLETNVNPQSRIEDLLKGVTPTGTKQISISQNGTTTEDVASYASAEITVAVPAPTYPIAENTAFGGGS